MQRQTTAVEHSPTLRIDFKKWGPLIALALLMALGTLLNPTFLSGGNLANVLTRSSFIGIIAVGATIVIAAGGIDLSVGSLTAFIAGAMILIMNGLVDTLGPGWNTILVGAGAAVAMGLLAGWINGAVTTKGKIDAFIVTLGAMGAYRSLTTYLADGGTISLDFGLRMAYQPVYYGTFLGVPIPVWVFAGVAFLGGLLLNQTRFGRYCLAIGSNVKVAEYSAVKVDRVRTLTFVFQGLCVALATCIYVPRLGSASGTTGILWELEAIAAAIIGGTALKGGSARIWGTVVGALLLSMIGNVLNLTNVVSQYLNGFIQGIIIVVAVLVQRGKTAE